MFYQKYVYPEFRMNIFIIIEHDVLEFTTFKSKYIYNIYKHIYIYKSKYIYIYTQTDTYINDNSPKTSVNLSLGHKVGFNPKVN